MKQLICLILILGSLFSCVKEKDYPVTFQYDHNSITTPNITDYTLVLSDSGLYISGAHDGDTLRIHIPKIGGNPLVVGEYTIGGNNGFYITHKSSTTGVTSKANSGTLNLSYVNSYVDFTFDAVLYNGIKISNGKAKNLPFITYENYNNQDTNNTLPIPYLSNVDTLTNGIYAEVKDVINPFYVPAANITKTSTSSSVTYSALDGFYAIEIELKKPINTLVGNTYDLTQGNQDLVKMQWRDISIPAPGNNLDLKDGDFHIFSLDPVTGEIEFGFGGHLYNINKTVANPIHVGYAKKLTI